MPIFFYYALFVFGNLCVIYPRTNICWTIRVYKTMGLEVQFTRIRDYRVGDGA